MTRYTQEDLDAAYYVNLDSGTRFDHRDRIAQLIADTREAATSALLARLEYAMDNYEAADFEGDYKSRADYLETAISNLISDLQGRSSI